MPPPRLTGTSKIVQQRAIQAPAPPQQAQQQGAAIAAKAASMTLSQPQLMLLWDQVAPLNLTIQL